MVTCYSYAQLGGSIKFWKIIGQYVSGVLEMFIALDPVTSLLTLCHKEIIQDADKDTQACTSEHAL